MGLEISMIRRVVRAGREGEPVADLSCSRAVGWARKGGRVEDEVEVKVEVEGQTERTTPESRRVSLPHLELDLDCASCASRARSPSRITSCS